MRSIAETIAKLIANRSIVAVFQNGQRDAERCTKKSNSKKHLPRFTGGGAAGLADDVKPIEVGDRRRLRVGLLPSRRAAVAARRESESLVTKIFLVDDHPLFRAGIRQSLAPFMEFCIVGEAGSARDAFVGDRHRIVPTSW